MFIRGYSIIFLLDRINAQPITSDTSENVRINAVAYGVTFAEVEVDIETGKIEVLEIYNIHDSGKILNHKLAEGQSKVE